MQDSGGWQLECSRGCLVQGCVPDPQGEQFLPQLFGCIFPCRLLWSPSYRGALRWLFGDWLHEYGEFNLIHQNTSRIVYANGPRVIAMIRS